MRKATGIMGVTVMLLALSLDNPGITAKANEPAEDMPQTVIETVKLPEYLTKEDFELLYTCKKDAAHACSDIIEVDQEDAVRLMTIGQAEAGETDPYAIAYVMKVIINRLNDDNFPNTIEEIINQKGQFAPLESGRYARTVPNANAHIALFLLESGQIDTEAKYFEAVYVKDSWQSRNREFEFEYGGHRFYK